MTDYPGTHWGEAPCASNSNLPTALVNMIKGAARFLGGSKNQRRYSMTTQRLGSTPVEWVVMLSMSCRAAWITWRS